jgi:hypothetical protein
MADKKKVDISKMNYTELISLLYLNPDIEIKAGTLFIILREFHKNLEKMYGLKPKPDILVPDKTIKAVK